MTVVCLSTKIMGWVVNATHRPLCARERGPVPITQGRSGLVGKIWPHTGIRSPDCPARCESQSRLSYPGPLNTIPNEIRK